jgi:hypothetical protein
MSGTKTCWMAEITVVAMWASISAKSLTCSPGHGADELPHVVGRRGGGYNHVPAGTRVIGGGG